MVLALKHNDFQLGTLFLAHQGPLMGALLHAIKLERPPKLACNPAWQPDWTEARRSAHRPGAGLRSGESGLLVGKSQISPSQKPAAPGLKSSPQSGLGPH